MRVMISQPLDATPDAERNMAKAEVVALLDEQGHEIWGEEISREDIPAGVNQELWQLGRRLQAMAGADAVYFMDGWAQDKACRLEYEACALMGEVGIPRNVFLEEDGRIIQEETETGISFRALDNKIKVLCSLLGIEETDLYKLLDTNPDKLGGGLGPNGYYRHCVRVGVVVHKLYKLICLLHMAEH